MSAFPTFKTEGDYNYMTYEGVCAAPSMNIPYLAFTTYSP